METMDGEIYILASIALDLATFIILIRLGVKISEVPQILLEAFQKLQTLLRRTDSDE